MGLEACRHSLHAIQPTDHRTEKQPFNLCVLWEAVLCSLECVEHAAAVGWECEPSQKE